MKNLFTLLSLLILASSPLFGQVLIEAVGISAPNLDVSNSTVVGQATINPTQAGKVIVRFDGQCYADVGDRIVLAASNTTNWGVNDGNIGVEVVNGDVDHIPFSHSRVYDVNPGSHTFYAVAHNYVETDGDGLAGIYATLTVEFYPANLAIIGSQGISESNLDVSNSTVVGQVTINPTQAGTVVVRFDGQCYADVGDRIVLAASNTTNWGVNDGNIGVEVVDGDVDHIPFSHSRVYDVDAGSQTFYAVAHNYVETDGDGLASIYATLTVEFYPASTATISSQGISESNLDVSNSTVAGQVTINPTQAGKVIVHFDGQCYADVGDRIVLAASNTTNWGVNDGSVGVEVVDGDVNHSPFSHTRVYDVDAGSQTFYAVAHNYVETDGDGLASIYATLTVKYVPNSNLVAIDNPSVEAPKIDIYPNPNQGMINVTGSTFNDGLVQIQILNLQGQTLHEELVWLSNNNLDVEYLNLKGIHFVKLIGKNFEVTKKVLFIK